MAVSAARLPLAPEISTAPSPHDASSTKMSPPDIKASIVAPEQLGNQLLMLPCAQTAHHLRRKLACRNLAALYRSNSAFGPLKQRISSKEKTVNSSCENTASSTLGPAEKFDKALSKTPKQRTVHQSIANITSGIQLPNVRESTSPFAPLMSMEEDKGCKLIRGGKCNIYSSNGVCVVPFSSHFNKYRVVLRVTHEILNPRSKCIVGFVVVENDISTAFNDTILNELIYNSESATSFINLISEISILPLKRRCSSEEDLNTTSHHPKSRIAAAGIIFDLLARLETSLSDTSPPTNPPFLPITMNLKQQDKHFIALRIKSFHANGYPARINASWTSRNLLHSPKLDDSKLAQLKVIFVSAVAKQGRGGKTFTAEVELDGSARLVECLPLRKSASAVRGKGRARAWVWLCFIRLD